MHLKQLIETLEKHDPAKRVPLGFGRPHSYRGYYSDLAFEPVENTTVGGMLTAARSAMGATYTGYKGGEYQMDEWTTCWLANYGDCGEGIGPVLLRYMLGEVERPA
jgi:hypothetical protein